MPEHPARLDVGSGAFKAARNSTLLTFGEIELQRTPKRRCNTWPNVKSAVTKNQLSPPFSTIDLPVLLASDHVSNVHCMTLGEHAEPVRSDVAVLEASNVGGIPREGIGVIAMS